MRVSDSPKQLASSFALAVTRESAEPKAWIARKGRHSLQDTLEKIIPQILLTDNEKRSRTKTKIATAAFLKALETICRFRRIRIRRQGMERESGSLLFRNRRWLRPSNSDDRSQLEHNFQDLCSQFPRFSQCSLSVFLDTIDQVSTSWSEVISKIRNLSQAPVRSEKSFTRVVSNRPELKSTMDVNRLLNSDDAPSQHTPTEIKPSLTNFDRSNSIAGEKHLCPSSLPMWNNCSLATASKPEPLPANRPAFCRTPISQGHFPDQAAQKQKLSTLSTHGLLGPLQLEALLGSLGPVFQPPPPEVTPSHYGRPAFAGAVGPCARPLPLAPNLAALELYAKQAAAAVHQAFQSPLVACGNPAATPALPSPLGGWQPALLQAAAYGRAGYGLPLL